MKEVKAFACDYCNMTSLRKSSVKRHEKESCRKNAARKTCSNCKYINSDEDGYFCDEIESELYGSLNVNMDCVYFVSNQP